MSEHSILILDYSTDRSEAELFCRWLPENVEVTILYINTEASFSSDLEQQKFTHVIHSGSFLSIIDNAPFTHKAIHYIRNVCAKRIPQMGICYGHQLLCLALLGKSAVRHSPKGLEAGWCEIFFHNENITIPGVTKTEILWQSHFDEVVVVPQGSHILATNQHTKIQAFINKDFSLFGTQFHPEFDLQTGNQCFQKDRKLLNENGYNVEEIIAKGPSLDAGKIFFNFFLNYF